MDCLIGRLKFSSSFSSIFPSLTHARTHTLTFSPLCLPFLHISPMFVRLQMGCVTHATITDATLILCALLRARCTCCLVCIAVTLPCDFVIWRSFRVPGIQTFFSSLLLVVLAVRCHQRGCVVDLSSTDRDLSNLPDDILSLCVHILFQYQFMCTKHAWAHLFFFLFFFLSFSSSSTSAFCDCHGSQFFFFFFSPAT